MWINAEENEQKLDFIVWNKLLKLWQNEMNFSGYWQEKNGWWLTINSLISVHVSYLYDKIPLLNVGFFDL